MADPVEVLDYWLGTVGPKGWYAGGAALDADIAVRFGELWRAAADGGLEHWAEGTAETLAYLIVTDQFSRNIHRGTPSAFATDPLALAAARRAVAEGWDMDAPEPERQFFYLPFEHSENADDQATAVALITERMQGSPETALHARAHATVIAEHGRFPDRNAALGRANAPAEEAFLAAGGYGAVVRRLKG